MDLNWVNFKGVKEVCLLQQSIVVFHTSYQIQFYDLETVSWCSYVADGAEDKGDGLQCVAAHNSEPIFAFAELVSSPRVIVKSFPSFSEVAVLKSADAQSYLSMCFSATDHLVALTGIGSFSLEVWNWRTTTLLGVHKNNVLSLDQFISCTPSTHFSIVQHARNLNQLKVWSLNVGFDSVKVFEIEFNSSHPTNDCEGFAVIDSDRVGYYDSLGNVTVASIAKRNLQSVWKGRGKVTAICGIEKGLICCTVDRIILFQDNESGPYLEYQSVQISSPILKLLKISEDHLLGFDENGECWDISYSATGLTRAKRFIYNWSFKFQSLFQDKLLAVNNSNVIELWDINERKLLREFPEHTPLGITCMTVDCDRASVFFGNKDSRVFIYQLVGLNLSLIHELYLSDNPITRIKWTMHALICSDQSGSHFIIQRESFEVLSFVSYAEDILELITIERDSHTLQLLFFNKTPNDKYSSDSVEVINCNLSTPHLITKQSLELPYKVASIAYSEKMGQFIANPYLTRLLKVLSLRTDNEQRAVIVDVKSLNYESKFKFIKFQANGDHLLIYGLDGEITMCGINGEVISNVHVAHRLRGEIITVLASPRSQYILVTDSTGNQICLKDNKAAKENPPQLKTINILETIHHPLVSWLESRQNKNMQSELQNNKQICQEMISKIHVLRHEIKKLLDENETKPEDETLPIQQFNLNETHQKLLHQEAHCSDSQTKSEMIKIIEKDNAIKQWLMENFWQRLSVKSTTIQGIFSDIRVENFSILNEDPQMRLELSEAIIRFQIEQLTNADVFQPFAPIDTNKLERILSVEPSCCLPEEIKSTILINRQPEVSGTTTITFVRPTFDRYNQMEVVSYQQCHMEELFGFFDALSLKIFFNAKFNELQKLKSVQMEQIRVKNERLRIIQSELNDLARLTNSRIKHKDNIVDPEFTIDEMPETIVQVFESEMTVKPFHAVSQRTQQSDEVTEDNVIQEMFNTAFREKCLQTMMDGVLEIRWEDEIKKTPAIPVALQARKELKDYDEHDMRAVKEYEEKLMYLGEERKKYQDMLQAEKGQLLEDLDQMISSFNEELRQLIALKIDVEMAVNQEYFKLFRNRQFNRLRIEYSESENEIKGQVQIIKKEIGTLTNVMHDFDKKIQELKTVLESAETRDRQLDKQFKNNFAEASSHAIVDQAYKFFKRRSRWTPKPWTTAAIFNDMARRIVAKNVEISGPPLNSECFEFLNLLEQNDQMSNCPNIMDERLWELLCRMRRTKMESEFRVRAITAQLTEAEQADQSLSKEVSHKKMALVAFDRRIAEVRERKQENMLNRTVQLVVKRGAIEVELQGNLSDFDDAILIAKSEVDQINRMIRRAGTKKLAAMNNAAVFRRKVLQKEWEHQVLKMKIKDMRGFVKLVEKCKITKDVQRWLSRKKLGRVDDVSQIALNREIDGIIGGFQKELQLAESDLQVLCRKIHSQKVKNSKLDREIELLNFDLNEQQKLHDPQLVDNVVSGQTQRLSAISERARLVRKIQKQHSQIVELTTLLELQRLRTYPTLNTSNNYHARQHVVVSDDQEMPHATLG